MKYSLWLLIFSIAAGSRATAQTNTPWPSSGSVGIGTTSPAYKLDVRGNASIGDGTTSDQGLHLNAAANAILRFEASGVVKWGLLSEYPYAGRLSLYDYTYGIMPLTVQAGGNVGIGTTNPDARLHVNGTLLTTNSVDSNHYYNVLSYSPGTGDHSGTIKLAMPTGPSCTMMEIVIRGYDYSSNGAWQLTVGGYNYCGDGYWRNYSAQLSGRAPFNQVRLAYDGAKNVILLGTTSTNWSYSQIEVTDVISNYSGIAGWGTGWSAVLLTTEVGIVDVVTPDLDIYTNGVGNVGIGTTNPTQKLSVNGTIRAKEVIVDTGWSDFVFDESYKLKALSETEAFIKAEKHLPGIPSAADVAENGITLGAMQAKLLAKIEELTLHVIAQEKKISALNERNTELEKDVRKLSTRAILP